MGGLPPLPCLVTRESGPRAGDRLLEGVSPPAEMWLALAPEPMAACVWPLRPPCKGGRGGGDTAQHGPCASADVEGLWLVGWEEGFREGCANQWRGGGCEIPHPSTQKDFPL